MPRDNAPLMDHQIDISIAGLGIILYSPFAVGHIAAGEDYLTAHFWEPEKVAEHVMACRLSAMGTGSPGDFRVRLFDGAYPQQQVETAMAAVRLGIEVRDQTLCVRDLYDLMDWQPECPAEQTATLEDGFYELTAYTQLPPSGIIGDHQEISIHFRPVANKPVLKWLGVPDLSGS